jgi:LAO/AO transport system kinase
MTKHAASPPVAGSALQKLLEAGLAGERAPLARLLSLVENEAPEARIILDAAFRRTGSAVRVGVTGPPGAGKSTLVASLARLLRQEGLRVAIVAVDPTSPFSGGALLGDRVRMPRLAGDEGVFIRSMASRGSLGGLASTTSEVCDVLEAAGYDWILIETVGVGQSELEVAENADTVVVVLVPESGDGVQAMKAGLMEIGDIFVLNKADREGADRAVADLKSVLSLKPSSGWRPPVLRTEARADQGVDAVRRTLGNHLEHLRGNGLLAARRRRRLKGHVLDLIRGRAAARLRDRVDESRWNAILEELEARRMAPHEAARRLWQEAWPGDSGSGPDRP